MDYMWHIFLVSFQISHGAIDHKFSSSIPQEVLSLDKAVDGLSITNSYGLFRRFVRGYCLVTATAMHNTYLLCLTNDMLTIETKGLLQTVFC